MTWTYTESDLEQIAAAINVPPTRVKGHARRLEAAALWLRLGRRAPFRPPPSKMRAKMKQISSSARRLLKHLGVDEPADAADGPGDPYVYEVLTYAPETDRDLVQIATERVGRLVELMEGIEAASVLHRAATQGVEELTGLGDLTVSKGHVGDE